MDEERIIKMVKDGRDLIIIQAKKPKTRERNILKISFKNQ